MSNTVTIVTYHYVRDLARTRYPEIKGLDLRFFREQLKYLKCHYTIITAQELIAAVQTQQEDNKWQLPRNALLLTFDDGYIDHFHNVFPLLDEMEWQGSFFPPVQAICEGRLLDVNKIHFLLATVRDKATIIDAIFRAMDAHRLEYQLESNEACYTRLAHASRHDGAEITFIKKALQRGLPAALRMKITDDLFKHYVSTDEKAFASELYMSMDQLRCMARRGMYIGSHGYQHKWLGHLTAEEQAFEIDESLKFLTSVGTDLRAWIMCYPHGDTNESLLTILRKRGCAVGLTTRPGIAAMDSNPLLLPRLDTNDLPKQAQAPPDAWIGRALELTTPTEQPSVLVQN